MTATSTPPPHHFGRYHGEKKGLTEDAFLSATIKLSHVCLGGIDAQLSEVSSDFSFEEDEDEDGGAVGGDRQQGVVASSRADGGRRQEAVR